MEELVEQYRNNQIDKDQLIQTLMTQYGAQVTRLAYSYVKDVQIAENIAQEVFIKCYKKMHHLKKNTAVKAWINSITVNKCKDHFRSGWVKNLNLNAKFMHRLRGTAPSPETELSQRIQHDELTEEVLALPFKYREAIICYHFQEMSINEISALLKIKVPTVSSRLRRGRQMLKERLEGDRK
ncbi:MAG TPA: sigma-70 family RNA polymerase sigma factor [Lentibacillus sp.]|uniref:sigma-70 family RNA polymerase sigma factor n=1 Tax=Lentibacillus sp. TaxID=1925746 RepID=UPI002B4B0EAE|nr:sigma-70 family RNA polymerase sigma factor [Lentibacillus sp.]HLR60933.1 sigma-70 family RNA polymerase sigma factor [Lentibacillus sp.]